MRKQARNSKIPLYSMLTERFEELMECYWIS